jgi:hypothetical protein
MILFYKFWWIFHLLQYLYLVAQIALQGSYSHSIPLCDMATSRGNVTQ